MLVVGSAGVREDFEEVEEVEDDVGPCPYEEVLPEVVFPYLAGQEAWEVLESMFLRTDPGELPDGISVRLASVRGRP